MASFTRRVVLDIGAGGIRLAEVVADRRGAPLLRNVRETDLGIDPTKNTEFFPAVLHAVENLVRTSGIKPGPAIMCMGGPSVFTRVIKVPQSDPNQVKQMVGYEAQQAIPAIEEACWDFQLFPAGSGGDLEAMILAIKKDSVEEMVVASIKAGLQVDIVELAPTAIINAFRFNYPEIQTPTLILEMGARSTNIVMVEGSKVFCRIVPLGGASITQAIATDLQESFAGAETLKRAKGFVHPGGSYEDPSDEIAARISKLSRGMITRLHTEVERSITFYRSQQGGSRPSQVFLAGGGAGLGLIDFFFKEKLKVPVQFFQPFRRIPVEGGVPSDAQKTLSAWACLAGTALRALPDTPCRINVMAGLQNQSLAKSQSRPALLVAFMVLAILAIFPGVHGLWEASRVRAAISPVQTQVEEAEALVIQLQKNRKNVSDRITYLKTATQLEQERLRWPLLLEGLARQCQTGMWITKLSVEAGTSNKQPETGSLPRPGVADSKVPLVHISGIFETKSEEADAQVVEQFRRSLEEAGVLNKIVTLERETPERSPDGKTEQVALKFALRGEWNLEPRLEPKSGEKAKQP